MVVTNLWDAHQTENPSYTSFPKGKYPSTLGLRGSQFEHVYDWDGAQKVNLDTTGMHFAVTFDKLIWMCGT